MEMAYEDDNLVIEPRTYFTADAKCKVKASSCSWVKIPGTLNDVFKAQSGAEIKLEIATKATGFKTTGVGYSTDGSVKPVQMQFQCELESGLVVKSPEFGVSIYPECHKPKFVADNKSPKKIFELSYKDQGSYKFDEFKPGDCPISKYEIMVWD